MNTTEKMIAICNTLPGWCAAYFLETGPGLSVTTRLAYSREISHFLDYLIAYVPQFSEEKKDSITLEQFESVTSQDISRYLTLYMDKGRQEKTLARKRAALSSFFNYMTANRKLSFNPVSAAVRVKVHQKDEVLHLDFAEQVDLLKEVDTADNLSKHAKAFHEKYRLRDIAMITLLLDTGIRVSELRGINVGDLDLEECSAVVLRKGGNIQNVYYSDACSEAINEYLNERKEQITPKTPLFVTQSGTRITVRSIERLVKKYASAAVPGKGQKISPHKLRSSFAMGFYEEEKDILALQRKMGHKSIVATNYYAKATDQKMQETRNVMADRRKREQ